jgi:uncharacterized protein YabE (DUF348 family)
VRNKILVGLLSAGIIASGSAGTAAYASSHKDVTLALDGSERTVSTFSGTVGELLQSQDVTVGEHDLVAPGPSDQLEDGERVVVRFGRELRLQVDGKPVSYWTTASTVDGALDQTGLRYEGAALSASRSAGIGREGLQLTVRTAKDVTVIAGGKRHAITTTGLTVADALAAAKVKADQDDRLSRKPTARITDGSSVKLVKVKQVTKKVPTSIAFKTVRQADSSIYKGESDAERAGSNGQLVSTVKVVYFDGKLKSKKVVSTKVAKKPVDAIVQYGTKEQPPPPVETDAGGSTGAGGSTDGGGSTGGGGGPVGGGVDSLNWGALAQCESGGDPNIVSSGGSFYGLYQFTISTWHSVGGSGTPIDNSAAEQTYRAKVLYKSQGASPWPVCGRNLFN